MYLLFPFLLCLFPIHTVFAENYAEISLKDYFFTLFITIILLLGTILGFNYFIQNLVISEWCVVFNFFAIFYANYIFIGLFSPYKRSLKKNKFLFAFCYLLLCILVTSLVIKLLSVKFALSCAKILFWFSSFVTLFIVMDLVKKIKKMNIKDETPSIEVFQENVPDIYHIVADAHPGFDKPEYCDEYFKAELEKRGFHIYQKAKSNYDITYCSLTSCLNMDYIHNIVPKPVDGLYTYPKVWPYYSKNKVFQLFKQCGYKLFFSVCSELAHLLEKKDAFSFSASLLSALYFPSFFAVFGDIKTISVKQCIHNHFKKYEKFSSLRLASPKYAFLHFLAPHLPFLVDENGRKNEKTEIMNTDKFLPYQKYVNKELLKLIDKIKANMESNSIILIHGDHSYPGGKEYSHNILLAVYFPEGYNPNCIAQDVTLVNLFPSILQELWGISFGQKADEFYNVAHRVGEIRKAKKALG